ncbi:MAG: glycosyl transferase family 2 [Pirellula sp.]|nr:glycosyl transferase family 2 [Pirellula sp.]
MSEHDDAPKVSVCMVTYNQERYIAQAIESVLAQETNFRFEIVIGEDCSTDSTRSIVRELAERHPDRIRPLFHERNLGGKQNFMRTYDACRGEYMAILEGDDYWICPHKLQRQVDALDARPDWAICFHPAEISYEDWRKPAGRWPETWEKSESTIIDLFDKCYIPTNAAVFRHRLFSRLPEWFADLYIGDWPLHILNAAHGNIGFLPEVMSVYRVHDKGVWSSLDHGTQMEALYRMLTAVDRHFEGQYTNHIEQCRLNILHFSINQAKDAKSDKERLEKELATVQASLDEILHSISFKIVRETIRPWLQLWRESQRMRSLIGFSAKRSKQASRAA